MISTVTWVRRGVAKRSPFWADLSEEEYKSLLERLGNRDERWDLRL